MGAAKRYFKDQFQTSKLSFEHDDVADFYLCSWQSGRSPVPLLCIRLILFLGCVAILASALVISSSLQHWAIYMTNWGVILITVSSGSALLVSIIATINGSIDSNTSKLPWYVTLYWVTYCVTTTVAFFITIFYYALLFELSSSGENSDWNPVLDVFTHGVNSAVMLCLLATARQPMHLLHFVYPFLAGLSYMAFSLFYYYGGGTNPNGETWIYPMLDWSNPGPTAGLSAAVAAALLVIHAFVASLAILRDFLTHKYCTKKTSITITKT